VVRAIAEISAPRTRPTWYRPAASAASGQPDVVSWSVMASVVMPASAATSTSRAGESVPSDAVECVWRSITPPG
jgi:hypothetical protein